jgi:hypothetical protein
MAKSGGSNLWKWLLGGAAVVGGVAWAVSASAKPAAPLTREQTRDLLMRILKDMNLSNPVTIDKNGLLHIENPGKTDAEVKSLAQAVLAGLRMRPEIERINPYGIFMRNGGNLPAYWDR